MGNACDYCSKRPDPELPEHTKGPSKSNPEINRNGTIKKSRKRKIKKRPLKSSKAKVTEAITAEITNQEKSEIDIKMIESALSNHFILKIIDSDGKKVIIDQMRHYSIPANEVIFQQSNPAECFFVLSSGLLEVLVNSKQVNIIKPGTGFGELALIDNCARSATVRTLENSVLWGLDRKTFKKSVESLNAANYTENLEFLNSVPLFQILTKTQKELIMSVMATQVWAAGEKVVKEGDTGESFFIIKDGMVSCSQKGIELRKMTKGNFFGEQALLNNCVRTATVTTVIDSKMISIGRNTILKVLGSNLEQILFRNTIRMSLEKSPVFQVCTDEQRKILVDKMRILYYEDSEPVILKGLRMGMHVWVVLKNRLKFSGGSVETFACIGDNYLVSKKKRCFRNSYYADGLCVVGEITKLEIKQILGGSVRSVISINRMLPALQKVTVLRFLSKSLFYSVAKAFKTVQFSSGEVIFNQNDVGDNFFIVQEGKVDIIKNNISVRSVNKFDYFGERSVLFNDVRSASAVAHGDLTCWVLDRTDFLRIVDENIRTQLQKRIEMQDDDITLVDIVPVKLLGKGQFGCVYLATHRDRNTHYALKIVTRQKISFYDFYENIILERKILMQLDHGMIVKLIKTFKDSKRLYFLMEFVRGMDLFDVLTVLGRLSYENGQFYAACLVLIIETLHELGIIYRDLKPENVMVDDEGFLKLIDFGTAKFINGKSYTLVGTPHYMAPEVITGSGYMQSADLWSLGVMIYEFFEGNLPFGEYEEDPYAIYEEVLNCRLGFNKLQLNEAFRELVEQLLSIDPINRVRQRLKEYRAFQEFNWDALISRELQAPYRPVLNSIEEEVVQAKKAKINLQRFLESEESGQEPIAKRASMAPELNWDDEF